MKTARFFFHAGMLLALLATGLGGCAPAGSADEPTTVIRKIRAQLDLPQLPLEEAGAGVMINSPSGNEAVINYRDRDGRIYSYDPALRQVIEIDARARLSVLSPDAAALSLEKLRARAKKFAAATVADFDAVAAGLRYEEGNKGDNYFFSWYPQNPSNTMMPPFLQIALYKTGELFAYYNTLALK